MSDERPWPDRPERTTRRQDPSQGGGRRRYASGHGKGSAGKGKGKKRKSAWRRWLGIKALFLYALGLGLLGAIGLGVAYARTPIPDPQDIAQAETTIVYWNDGETELGRFSSEGERVSVASSAIPAHVKNAVVAAEDRSFYENDGFDVRGMLRAGLGYVRGGGEIVGGGSTITQQYVKNFYLTQDQTVSRKVNELFIAVKLDQQLSKDDILTSYLNTIWFGRGAHGVETAAQSYFGVSVSDLTVEQGAALAAILRSPHRYDPTLGPENTQRFQERFAYVIDGMVTIGAIDQATADAAVPPEVLPEQKSNRYSGTNGYLMQQVRRELVGAEISEAEIDTGGLRIVTTFDQKAQQAAVTAVQENMPTDNAENVHVGLASVVPGDGAVVAMYGGEDAVTQPFDNAVRAAPGVGSTIKPFTLLAALEQGIGLESRYTGDTIRDPILGEKPVQNLGDRDYGRDVSLIEATEQSINTAYVDLVMQMGPEKVDDALLRAGVPDRQEIMDDLSQLQGPRVTLGAAPIPAVDMADAYATLAAGGRQADWYTVKKVTAPGGQVLHEVEPQPEPVFDPRAVADVTYALTQVVEGKNGTGHAAQELGRPAAGKTGTHEDLSAWFSGYTPQLATTVAMFRTDYGADEQTMMSLDGVGDFNMTTGGRFPAAIWTDFMKAALDGQETAEFPDRADVGEVINPSPTPTPTPSPTPTPTPTERPGRGEGNGPGGGGDESGGDQSGGDQSGGDQSGGDQSGNDWGGADGNDPDPTDPPTESPTPSPSPTDDPGNEWGGPGNGNGNKPPSGDGNSSDDGTGEP